MSANEGQVAGDHYKKKKIQHWDYVIANEIPYMEAQVIRYVGRWRDKGGIVDLQKARHFLDKLIEVEGERLNAQDAIKEHVDKATAKAKGHTSG